MNSLRTKFHNFKHQWNHFWHVHERHVSTLAFIAGFTWDNIMLRRIDVLIDNIFFGAYFSITAIGIVLYNALDARAIKTQKKSRLSDWLPFIIQFSFGALFSGFFVFYSRSASLFSSWPFLIFLLVMLFGNEHVRHHYAKLTFQVAIFFIVTFSYTIFLIPILVHSMGPAQFILSGITSLAVVLILMYLLYRATPERYLKSRPLMLLSIALIYITFNVLYFENIIPPIPLSLKEIGVYHAVEKNADGRYNVEYEPLPWYDLKDRLYPVFHHQIDTPIYVYTAVFAPTSLNVTVFHEWFYYDETSKQWIEANRIPYPVTGGGNNGFRGYSTKSNIVAGKWRVDVVTEREQLLGRTTFTVVDSDFAPKLETSTR